MSSKQQQRGAVLIISLIMLVVMTLLAVSAINMSTINLRIVGNMQAQMEAEVAVQDALEEVVSDLANFDAPAITTPTVRNYDVEVDKPICVQYGASPGFETGYDLNGNPIGTRYDNDWIVRGRNDSSTRGESVEITQGVRIREMLAPCD